MAFHKSQSKSPQDLFIAESRGAGFERASSRALATFFFCSCSLGRVLSASSAPSNSSRRSAAMWVCGICKAQSSSAICVISNGRGTGMRERTPDRQSVDGDQFIDGASGREYVAILLVGSKALPGCRVKPDCLRGDSICSVDCDVLSGAGPLEGNLGFAVPASRASLLHGAFALLRPFAARRCRGAHSRVR